MRSRSKLGFLLAALLVSACLGCGDKAEPTGDLSGEVLANDEPVGDCIVALYSVANKDSLGAKVDLEGKFQLNEIPIGKYEVSVLQKTSNDAEDQPFDTRIPQKYRDGRTSGLSVEIEEGENSMTLEMSN